MTEGTAMSGVYTGSTVFEIEIGVIPESDSDAPSGLVVRNKLAPPSSGRRR
jgi:hypothetical protein